MKAWTGMPKFIGQLQNVTVSEGRDATFTCSVTNLGGHKVITSNSCPCKKEAYNLKQMPVVQALFLL